MNIKLHNYCFMNNNFYLPENIKKKTSKVIGSKRDMYIPSIKERESIRSHCHINTCIDKTINLQKFIDKAKKANEKALKDVGTSIDTRAVPFYDTTSALREALNEKYARASAIANSYKSKQAYLEDKYFNSASAIYECDLTEDERQAGFIHEKAYIELGHIGNLLTSDSLFRGMSFDLAPEKHDKIQRDRRVVNKQIENILTQAGIDKNKITNTCMFTVTPYDYKISVSGVDTETQEKIEKALNIGNNGKNLYYHIQYVAVQTGSNSKQITKDGYMKMQAFTQIEELTGLKINKLKERNGSYFTDKGEDIKNIIEQNINKKVPVDYRKQLKVWLYDMITNLSTRGWNNVPDMPLSILYTKDGLIDYKQDVIYDGKSTMDKVWYSVT